MNRLAKRVLSMLMAGVLLTSVLSVSASAAKYSNVKIYKTVSSLGDSIPSGFSLPDYNRKANGKFVMGKTRVEGSYPAIVADAVAAKTFYPLAQPGFRTTELRILVDPNYDGDYVTAKYIGTLSNNPDYTTENIKAQRSEYINKIKASDLVMIDIGFNDTWLPVLGAILDVVNDKPTSDANQATADLAKAVEQEGIDSVMNTITYKLKNTPRYTAQLVTAVTGILTSSTFQENYDAIIKRIYAINPDVTVVALESYNPFKDWEDLSWLADVAQTVLYDHMNQIKRSYKNTYGEQYYSVNVDNVEIITTSAAQASSNGWDPHPTANGHKYEADQIIAALPVDYTRKVSTIRTLTKVNDVWGVYDSNGKMDTSYTGLARTANHIWFVRNGKLDQSFNGTVKQDGTTYRLKQGCVVDS